MSIKTSAAIGDSEIIIPGWYERLGKMQFVRLKVKALAIQDIHLPPYLGSTLRGAFGVALMRTCCVQRRQTCRSCRLRLDCVYSYIFDTPIEDEAESKKRYSNAPHPFVFHLDLHNKQEIGAGEAFYFQITIFGRAIKHLPYIVLAFDRMGRFGIGRGRGRFKIECIKAINADGSRSEIIFKDENYSPPSLIMNLVDAEKHNCFMPDDSIEIELLTPLRLIRQGRLCKRADFSTFVRNLCLRLLNLQRFHGWNEADMPVAEMVAAAEKIRIVEDQTRWFDWQRFSNRQGRWMTLGGLVGRISFRGDLHPFLPLLVMGSWINLGKGTSFGLGRYRLNPHERRD